MEPHGMYGILKEISEIAENIESWTFTNKELSQVTGLSQDTTSKNLSRLVKIGILVKIETRESNSPQRGSTRQVYYKLKEGALDFINHLY